MKRIYVIILSLLLCTDIAYAGRYHGHRRSERLHPEREVHKVVEVTTVVLPAPVGPKKLIAVTDFENKTSTAGQSSLGTGMADQLITALINTGRFIVLERQSIEAILQEQNFGTSSRTTQEGGAKIGELTRSQILIQGAVTEFEQRASAGGGGIAIEGFQFSATEATAHVAVDIRVYDTTTGQILASKACKGTAKASGGKFSYSDGDVGFMAGGEARTPLDYAVREAITHAVDFIILELQKVPWEGRIATIKDNDIYINCGRLSGILEGDQFSVYKPGEPIVDPDTGLNLGSENMPIGRIEVVKVEEKYSKAIPVNGAGFDRNDIIKYEGPKPPPPLPVVVVPGPQQQ